MDIIGAIIYIFLFILLMVFVFSMGLLTPIIGKKDIISVLAIGFVVGLVGGTFFISPIYQEMPYVVGSVYETIGDNNETITAELSPSIDENSLITELKQKEGVISVSNKGIVLKTDPFPEDRKKIIEEKIPIVDENFKNFSVQTGGLISINFTGNYDPSTAIDTLSEWLMYSSGINVKYSSVIIQINAKSNSVNEITDYLESKNIVVNSIDGPVQNAINSTKESMIDTNYMILISGIIGVIVAIISIFFDNITEGIRRIIIKIRNR